MNPKFTGLALAGLLAQAAASKPAFAQRKVSAKSLRKVQRKLDEEQEITSDYSVSFNTCLHIKVNDENLYADDYVDYVKAGQVEAVKSMVVFDVCKTEYCEYESDSNLHSIDLATWVGSLVEAPVNKKESYCEACRESDEYCNPEEEEEEDENDEEGEEDNEEEDENDEEDEDKDEEEDENDEEDEDKDEEEEDDKDEDEDRKLAVVKRHLEGSYVDCNTCAAQGCFDEDEENDGDDAAIQDEDVVDWIQELAECVELEDENNDVALYAGLTCNGDGTGVTIGVFMDEDCTLLTSVTNFRNILSNDADISALYQESGDLMTYSFLNDVSCAEAQYKALGQDEEEEEEEDEDEEDEVNEVCQNLVGGDMYVDINNCEQDDEEQEEENDDNQNNWYSFDLSQEQSENAGAVCAYIADFEGNYEPSNVDYETSENNEGGSLYDYSAGKSSGESGAGMIVGIIVLVLAIIGVTVAAVSACTKKSSADSKREPLNKNGQMA
jgi:hypothetical protein